MTLDGLIKGDRARTAHQFVHESLRRAILSGELSTGTHLVQAELALQLDVSTTPVREALRDLATEGLVRFDPHRGAIVRELELDEVREIYELRKVLEPLAIRRAIERISMDELDRVTALQQEMDQAEDPGRWVELNREFHAVFADAARSPRLQSILAGLRNSSAAYVALTIRYRTDRIVSGNQDHRALIDAFRMKDVDRAIDIELAHLDQTMAVVEEARGLAPGSIRDDATNQHERSNS